MGPAATLAVLVRADGITQTQGQLRGLQGSLTTTASGASKTAAATEDMGKRGSRAFGVMKGAATAFAGVAVFDLVRKGIGAAVSEYQEAQKVGAQTNAVIKSTGAAANVTAKQVDTLAASISKKAGIDDEAIQSGENLLLTFKGVQNQVGAGNDIFNQATQTMTDMSVALGQDMKSSAIQLGKALNDPITGITALKRVGVTFTAQQQDQIKTLVESGKTLEAQKVILTELNSEFGGSAAAAATPLDKLHVALMNLAEAAGSVLVPAMSQAAKVLTDVLNFMQEHVEVPIALGIALGVAGAAFLALKISAGISAVMAAASAAIAAVGGASGLAAIGVGALDVAIGVLTSPITAIIAVVGGLIALLVHLYQTNKTVRDVINAVWNAIKSAVSSVVSWLSKAVPTAWNAIKSATSSVWNFIRVNIVNTCIDIFKAVRGTIGDVVHWIDGAWHTIHDATASVWHTVVTAITGTLDDIWKAITGTIGDVIHWLDQAWKDIVKGVSNAFNAVGKTISSIWEGIVNTVVDFVNQIIKAINFVINATGGSPIGLIGHTGKQGQSDAGHSVGGHTGKGFAKGGAYGRTGGLINSPFALFGEEAPSHKEWVIPENPAYRNRALGLLMSAAKGLGLAKGGTFMSTAYGPPWGGIEGSGVTATGVNLSSGPKVYGVAVDPNVIPLGSNISAKPNPFDYSGTFKAFDTGGAIKGNRLDFYDWMGRDHQNAWGRRNVTVDVSGKAIKGIGGAGGLIGGGFDQKKALGMLPGTKGLKGFTKGIGASLLGTASKWIKSQAASVGGAVGAGISGGQFEGNSPTGVGHWGGWPVANWIIPELQYASQHGWHGGISSGWRDPNQVVTGPVVAPQGHSEHAGTAYPHGAVDFGGPFGGTANRDAFMAAVHGYKGPKLIPAQGFRDDGHMSGTGAAQGGVVSRNGPMVQIDHAEFHTDSDMTKFTRQLGFRLVNVGA